jgi:hypothetical protein
MSYPSWARPLGAYLRGKNVVCESELLAHLVACGRAVNGDWPGAIAHAMRVLGWYRSGPTKTYRPKRPSARSIAGPAAQASAPAPTPRPLGPEVYVRRSVGSAR